MDDDHKKPEDAAAEAARDAAQDEGAEPRKVSEEELKQILAAHETWLETDGRRGERADLSRTNLQGAKLVSANLKRADLHRAHLQGADLDEANLQRANLQGADLRGANLQGADLDEANLQRANLSRTNLQGADLRRADLQGADLGGADLRGANLTLAWGLTQKQLDEACGDDKTTLPHDLADYQRKPCPKPEESPSN